MTNKTITLYGDKNASQLIVIHSFQEDKELYQACQALGCHDFVIASISQLDWDNELSPWPSPALYKKMPAFKGEANDYLKTFKEQLLPEIMSELPQVQSIYIAGYSLAGLFALYSCYHLDIFDGVISASGSYWYPDFLDYVKTHTLSSKVRALYFSLGDKESHTKHTTMKQVEEKTRAIVDDLSQDHIVYFKLNEGGHFQDENQRVALGIYWMLNRNQ